MSPDLWNRGLKIDWSITYRLVIEDVYKGSQWQDTCLGELVFTPAAPLRAQLAADSFLKDHWGEITGE